MFDGLNPLVEDAWFVGNLVLLSEAVRADTMR